MKSLKNRQRSSITLF